MQKKNEVQIGYLTFFSPNFHFFRDAHGLLPQFKPKETTSKSNLDQDSLKKDLLQEYMTENDNLKFENSELLKSKQRTERSFAALMRENERLSNALEQLNSGLSHQRPITGGHANKSGSLGNLTAGITAIQHNLPLKGIVKDATDAESKIRFSLLFSPSFFNKIMRVCFIFIQFVNFLTFFSTLDK